MANINQNGGGGGNNPKSIRISNQDQLHDYVSGKHGDGKLHFADDFHGHGVQDAFKDIADAGTVTSRGFSTDTTGVVDLKRKVDQIDKAKDRLTDLDERKARTKGDDRYLQDLEKELKRDAKGHFKDMSAANKAREKALRQLEKEKTTTLKDLNKRYGDARKDLLDSKHTLGDAKFDAQLKDLDKRYDNALDHVDTHYEKHVTKLNDEMALIAEHTTDLEKATGLKASELVGSKTAAGLADSAKAGEAGIMKRIGANFSKGGAMGKVKTTLGVLVGGGIAYSGFKDLMASGKDEQGNDVQTSKPIALLKIAGGILAGGFVAQHGGAKFAR